MIAKRIPAENENLKGTYAQVAPVYGLTEQELRRADYDFLQVEGYAADGHECQNLHEWLTYEPKPDHDPTPWQKGDDNPQ